MANCNGQGNKQFIPSSVEFVPTERTCSEVAFGWDVW